MFEQVTSEKDSEHISNLRGNSGEVKLYPTQMSRILGSRTLQQFMARYGSITNEEHHQKDLLNGSNLYTVGHKGFHFCFVVALQLLNRFSKILCDLERI
jgi:hypothetical protein